MIPENVQRRWAAKAESLRGTRNLALPYPSAVAVSLAGTWQDSELTAAIALVISRHPDELPLDGGAAKCRQIDSAFYENFVARTGRRPRGFRSLEAAWLATDEALYYVSPHVGEYLRWPWHEIDLRPTKQGRRFGRVRLHTLDGTFEVGVGASGMANLLAVYSWSQLPDTERGAADEPTWARIGLDAEAPQPSAEVLGRIGSLYGELGMLLAEPAPALAEVQRKAQILVELHDLGARVDADVVNDHTDRWLRGKDPGPLGGPRSQEEFDGWQRTQVERRDAGELSMEPPPWAM